MSPTRSAQRGDVLPARAFPIVVFLVVLTTVFVVEAAIMFLMPLWGRYLHSEQAIALVDSLLLTTVVSPVLWFIVVRPLRRVSEHRAHLLADVHNAQENERTRLSRDLHDDLGQRLTAAVLALRAAEASNDASTARERTTAARTIVSGALDNVRGLSRGLRPSGLAELGLVASVERVIDEVLGPMGVDGSVQSELSPGSRLPPAVESGVFRIIQEALTNAAKHSQAKKVRVLLRSVRGDFVVEVRDDGKGIPDITRSDNQGVGLKSMRERAALLDGKFDVVSGPGKGTTIHVRIPRILATV
jgi:signal transduction histidine kinase